MNLPKLSTPRLRLQPLCVNDAPRIAELGSDPVIAAFTANMPSPYTLKDARAFVERSREAGEKGDDLVFGIHLRAGALTGIINLRLNPRHHSGHLGYWIGAPYRGQGYMTEAVKRVMTYGFETLGLRRIHTSCLATNSASAKVLRNAGFESEGCSRQAFFKNGVFHDLLNFGVLATDEAVSTDDPT